MPATAEVHKVFVIGEGGAITGIGKSPTEIFDNLCAGKTAVKQVSYPNVGITTAAPLSLDGIGESLPERYQKKFRRASPAEKLSTYAYFHTLRNAGLVDENGQWYDDKDKRNLQIVIGSGLGGAFGLPAVYKKFLENPRSVGPQHLLQSLVGRMAASLTMIDGLTKGARVHVAECASGNDATIGAYKDVKHGYTDMAYVGGTEASVVDLSLHLFNRAQSLYDSTDPEGYQVLDKNRKGFAMGDGGGGMLLVNQRVVEEKHLEPVAELIGFGDTSDGYEKGDTAPDPEGKGAEAAYTQGLLAIKERVDGTFPDIYGNVHGTGTELNDELEIIALEKAIENVFGSLADFGKFVISSSKRGTAHTLGACGVIESNIIFQAFKRKKAPPTSNISHPIPTKLTLAANEPVKGNFKYGVNGNMGFGGMNKVVVYEFCG